MEDIEYSLNHMALLQVGFRPFFVLAFLFGSLLPLLWVGILHSDGGLGLAGLNPVQWHAHEMLFGFGWAVLGGFLLTASKNWLHIRGLHGWPLAAVALIWLLERIYFFVGPALGSWNKVAELILLNLSVLTVAGYVCGCLLIYRRQDSFKDNYFFLLGLPLLLVSKNLILLPEYFPIGIAMSIGMFRLAFAVMFERTMTQFMKNGMGVQIFRHPYLDWPIKFVVWLCIFQALLPTSLAAPLLLLAGSLLLVRFFLWKPHIGIRSFGIAIMYIGYAGLTAHFFFEAARLTGVFMGVGTIATHVFTFLCMGVVIPGMLIRIPQGHTGRKLSFTFSDRVAICLMIAGAFFRLVATQIWPDHYLLWTSFAGVGWAACFAIVGFRLTPFLFQPRVDGRIH